MLTLDVKQQIQKAYSQLLKNKELKSRPGQKLMIAHIARNLAAIEVDAEGHRINDAGICAIEAGTGTGKTVAYTLAVLPMAKAMGKKVVISTATIALQEQILYRDLPDILHHSGLNFRFALAKGRARYLCLSKLDHLLNTDSHQSPLLDLDFIPQTSSEQKLKLYESMAKALLTSKWDGDKDNWPEELDNDDWIPLTAERNQCSGRRCQHVAQCSFIKARDNLSAVDCVVANHDLVMADLALGGGAILPDPADTIYIFDEAHHLSDKALKYFAGQIRLNASIHWFDQSIRFFLEVEKNYPQFIKMLDAADGTKELLLEIKNIYLEVKPIIVELVEPLFEDFSKQKQLPFYRFKNGEIPQHLSQLAQILAQRCQMLVDTLATIHGVINAALESNESKIPLGQLEQLFSNVGVMVSMAERQWQVWRAYANKQEKIPDSRWIQIVDVNGILDFDISTSPLLAAETLTQFLWKRCFAAVLTSATLTALGTFDRLVLHAGIPDFTDKVIVPSPFDFTRNARFVVPKLVSDPTNHEQHSEEIAQFLPRLIENHVGILVLFASKRQLNDVYEMLPEDLQGVILCQNNMSKKTLIEKHIELIDAGKQSILFGLASFAEGVDLPGKYCTHVIIAKLPFSVPNDPVESSLSEWLETQGRNGFMEISLPDASQKLIQACGRLIRNEQDTGEVTLLDKRILTKHYGARLMNALPAFQRVFE